MTTSINIVLLSVVSFVSLCIISSFGANVNTISAKFLKSF